MTAEPNNADRAQWAKDALAVFTAETFSGDHPDTMERDDLESAIGDLICDLIHYARKRDFDTGSILQQACGHFGAELLDEQLHTSSPQDIQRAHSTSTDQQPPAWIHIVVRGGVVQYVGADVSARVIVEDHDTDERTPSVVISLAEPLQSSDLAALLTKQHVPHRIVCVAE